MHLPDLNYECVHCGYSCETLAVELTPVEFEALESTAGPESVVRRDGRFWLRKDEPPAGVAITPGCGACHFLLDTAEARCGLHRAQGVEAKPRPCRDFPFRAVNTPGGVYVGVSFACKAIVERLGPPVSGEMVVSPPLELAQRPMAPGIDLDWERYVGWETRVLDRLRTGGHAGLWSAALELSVEVLGGGALRPTPQLEGELQAVFRGLLALAEGPMSPDELLAFLQSHAAEGVYESRILGKPVDLAELLGRWEEPWSLWAEVEPFFEHLLFRKYLLEGPDVHARVCSLPIMAQLLQFLVLARSSQPDVADVHWALRLLEARLTFHARGLDRYLGRCGSAFLGNLTSM